MKIKDFKKALRQEANRIVPDIIEQVKPKPGYHTSYKDHLEVVHPPKRSSSIWNKRFAMQFASAILIITLSFSIILASLNPQEAVMSKEEFEEVMTEMVNVEINLWDYLPSVLSPKEDAMPTSLTLVAHPLEKPDIESDERVASRQLSYFQDIIQLLDMEFNKMNEFYQNRSAVLSKATEEFGRGRGKSNIAFQVNNRSVEVKIASKHELNMKVSLDNATYDLSYGLDGTLPRYNGTIAFASGQTISFELSQQSQKMTYVGAMFAKTVTFEPLGEATIGKFIEYTKTGSQFQVSNQGVILIDDVNTYVLTDYPLLEEELSALIYEIEVYDNESGDFIFSKIVAGAQEVYRFDLEYLEGFTEVTFHQTGVGIFARKEFRVDGVRFVDTEDYAIVHRALAIRQVGNGRFGLTRFVAVPYLLVTKNYYDELGVPSPFTLQSNYFDSMMAQVEILDSEYQAFITQNHDPLSV
jgi:hypothetical protein